ncbi:hypothetical protein BH11PSE2_BH11PSE2_07500 [soil metagenome]
MRRLTRHSILFALCLALAACGPRSESEAATAAPPPAVGQSRQLTGGWFEVRPEPGLSVQLREGWRANRAQDGAGPIVFSGPGGAQVIVWPIFIPAGAKMPPPAAIVTQLAGQMARQFNWSQPGQFGQNGVRMFGQAGQMAAQASFVYTTSPKGTAGYWYLTSAPRAQYPALQPTFAALMPGVRLYGGSPQPANGPSAQANGPQASAPQNYIQWREPNEGAYTASVPQGWRVTGGIVRPEPLRLLDPAELTSPDGRIYAFSGDRKITSMRTPTQQELRMGSREGTYSGSAVLMHYRPAAEIIAEYVQARLGPQCGQVKIDSVQDQKDLTGPANRQLAASAPAGTFKHVDAALALFHCGPDRVGLVQLATQINGIPTQGYSEGVGLWEISGVAGFIAPQSRATEAGQVLIRFMSDRRVNPQWVQQNASIAPTVSAISRQASDAMAAQIARHYYTPASALPGGGGSTASSSDDLSRRRSNAMRDQTDVVDQTTGQSYKVESGSNYYWIDPAGGTIAGTNTPSQPSINFQAMTQLP